MDMTRYMVTQQAEQIWEAAKQINHEAHQYICATLRNIKAADTKFKTQSIQINTEFRLVTL